MDYHIGPAHAGDLPELGALANRIFRAARTGDMTREYPLLMNAENSDNLRVARAGGPGGRIVSHVGLCIRQASILGASVRVASVGSVGTEPEHRGRGLASRLMDDARRHAVQSGASLMLISGGRGLYHRLGYVQVGAFPAYTVPCGEPDSRIRLTSSGDEHLPMVAAIQQAEPVRFIRPLEDWRRLLAAGTLMNQPSDLYLVDAGAGPVAYAAVQRPVEGRPPQVQEYGGSRAALAAAVPHLARQFASDAVKLFAASQDRELAFLAADRGWAAETHTFPGTLGIIDAVAFLPAVVPLVRERVGDALAVEPAGEGVVLTAGGQSVRLETQGQLTALLFGGETEEARAVPRLPPAVAEPAGRAFPLPLLWYGYNYV